MYNISSLKVVLMLTAKGLNKMTKMYSFTKRLLAGAVVLFGVFTASATEWTYEGSGMVQRWAMRASAKAEVGNAVLPGIISARSAVTVLAATACSMAPTRRSAASAHPM